MTGTTEPLRFAQLHVDVARNATDDFNPFHDPVRWSSIRANPFPGPVVLGFQLLGLVAARIDHHRLACDEHEQLDSLGLRFSNFECRFAGAVLPGQDVEVVVKPSRTGHGGSPALSNRVALYADGRIALTGFKRETRGALYLPDVEPFSADELDDAQDRTFLRGGDWFLKRKFISNGHAKNFLCASLVNAADYIDELAGEVNFPEVFPCALLSCALLERAWCEERDFERHPFVYQSHRLSIDRDRLAALRSHDRLHLLTRQCADGEGKLAYECLGIVSDQRPLFSGRIDLMRLGELT